MTLPLAGRRVLVTRAVRQASKLSDELRALGAIPVEVPVLQIAPPESFDPLDAAICSRFTRYDWLIVTSTNAAEILGFRASLQGISLRAVTNLKVAAIGAATAAAVEKLGFKEVLTPTSYVAESLAVALCDQIDGKRVLIARAAIARDVIPDALRAAGAQVDVIDVYRNVLPEAAPEELRRALEQGIDAATFTSSSSVTHLKEAAEKADLVFPFSGISAISIGPITSQTLREHGWEPAAEANPHDIPGLIAAVRLNLDR